jgi:hypothetical protein
MTRLLIAVSLVVVLAFTASSDAKSSGSRGHASPGDSGFRGRIQSVATTNFVIGTRKGRHGRFRPIVVHYNPDTVTLTLDGSVVRVIDYKATHKYAVVFGTIKNDVLEATSITVTSSAPVRHKKSKSST